MTKITMWKKCQKKSNNYIQTTCISSYHGENTCKGSKQSIQTVRGGTHKPPRVNVDGWTNGRKLARLSRPAKAGATKSYINDLNFQSLVKSSPTDPIVLIS